MGEFVDSPRNRFRQTSSSVDTRLSMHTRFPALLRIKTQTGIHFLLALLLACVGASCANAQKSAQPDIQHLIDASVAAREDNLVGYTVTERYRVFRGDDMQHAAAEMTVKTTYRKETGKSYVILAQSGSQLLLKELLGHVLESEQMMTQPVNRGQALITSANYRMTVKGNEPVQGRLCVVVAIAPMKNTPYLFNGTIWVDPQDGSIVQLRGLTSKSPSMLAGTTEISRQYQKMNGFSMATHAAATSSSWLLGRTVIEIDYDGYNLQSKAGVVNAGTAAPPAATGKLQ
jgi:hypothetical protein